MSKQKTGTERKNLLKPRDYLLLHLTEIETDSYFRKEAYPHEQDIVEKYGPRKFEEEPDYVQTDGLSFIVYGKVDRAKVGPRLKDLLDQNSVKKGTARRSSSTKPSAYYRITEKGQKEIVSRWEALSEQVWCINFGKVIKKLPFKEILSKLKVKRKKPSFVRLYKKLITGGFKWIGGKPVKRDKVKRDGCWSEEEARKIGY